MSSMRIAAACVLALAVAAPLAVAATVQEEERKQYKDQVEPICKKNAEENKSILKGVREKVNKGKLVLAGQQFIKAAAALRKTLSKLKEVPRPPSDEAKLKEWLKRIGEEATLLQKVGKALKEEKRRRAESLSAQLEAGARLTNSLVVPFGFRHCRFETTIS
ncbi:MAG TPA: hypothetical protein VIE64_02575 [Solirubrobacterales bacterium]|jgi:hypothetical protein